MRLGWVALGPWAQPRCGTRHVNHTRTVSNPMKLKNTTEAPGGGSDRGDARQGQQVPQLATARVWLPRASARVRARPCTHRSHATCEHAPHAKGRKGVVVGRLGVGEAGCQHEDDEDHVQTRDLCWQIRSILGSVSCYWYDTITTYLPTKPVTCRRDSRRAGKCVCVAESECVCFWRIGTGRGPHGLGAHSEPAVRGLCSCLPGSEDQTRRLMRPCLPSAPSASVLHRNAHRQASNSSQQFTPKPLPHQVIEEAGLGCGSHEDEAHEHHRASRGQVEREHAGLGRDGGEGRRGGWLRVPGQAPGAHGADTVGAWVEV